MAGKASVQGRGGPAQFGGLRCSSAPKERSQSSVTSSQRRQASSALFHDVVLHVMSGTVLPGHRPLSVSDLREGGVRTTSRERATLTCKLVNLLPAEQPITYWRSRPSGAANVPYEFQNRNAYALHRDGCRTGLQLYCLLSSQRISTGYSRNIERAPSWP